MEYIKKYSNINFDARYMEYQILLVMLHSKYVEYAQ